MPHFLFLFICQWTLGIFDFLAVVSNASMDMGVQICVQGRAFISLGHVSRSGSAGSDGTILGFGIYSHSSHLVFHASLRFCVSQDAFCQRGETQSFSSAWHRANLPVPL